MRAYCAIFKARTAALFQYRLAALAGMSTQVFWGIVKVMILQAFYAQSTQPEPISLSQAMVFVWLGQALLGLLPWNIDKELESQIKTGHVAYELVRPIHLYWLWFFRSIALRIVPTAMRSLPIILVAGLFFGFPLPISWSAGAFFCLSLLFSLLLSAAMSTLIFTSLFWTLSGEGVQKLLPHLTILLSGLVVPLPLFPGWMQPFMSLQPFRGLIDIPIRIYIGVIPSDEFLYYAGFQCFWILIFMVIGQWVMRTALKRVIIQGG